MSLCVLHPYSIVKAICEQSFFLVLIFSKNICKCHHYDGKSLAMFLHWLPFKSNHTFLQNFFPHLQQQTISEITMFLELRQPILSVFIKHAKTFSAEICKLISVLFHVLNELNHGCMQQTVLGHMKLLQKNVFLL